MHARWIQSNTSKYSQKLIVNSQELKLAKSKLKNISQDKYRNIVNKLILSCREWSATVPSIRYLEGQSDFLTLVAEQKCCYSKKYFFHIWHTFHHHWWDHCFQRDSKQVCSLCTFLRKKIIDRQECLSYLWFLTVQKFLSLNSELTKPTAVLIVIFP